MNRVPIAFPLVMTPLGIGMLLLYRVSGALIDAAFGALVIVGPWLIVALSRRSA